MKDVLAVIGGVFVVLTICSGIILFFLYLLACGMSDAPHTCALPFLGYIN